MFQVFCLIVAREISGDLVLISAGVRPNIVLASKSGIKVNRGVLVDQHLKTSTDNVYAAGDITEFEGKLYGIIPAAIDQANIAAVNMLEKEQKIYNLTIPTSTLKVVGIDLTSMGIVNPEEKKYEEIKRIDTQNSIYKKLVLEKGKIVGAILLGDRKGVTSITKLMAQKTDITKYKEEILNDDFNYKNIDDLT